MTQSIDANRNHYNLYIIVIMIWLPVAYFTKELNWSLAKPPLKFSGGLAKLGWTSLVK